jgi:two-component system nitrogen regulation sensor histidine kinase NtrY
VRLGETEGYNWGWPPRRLVSGELFYAPCSVPAVRTNRSEVNAHRPEEMPSGSAPGRRRTIIFVLALAIFLLFTIVFSLQAFNLSFLGPTTSQQTLIFAALAALIFVSLVALTLVLLRILLKLAAERRVGVLGSKFRTRMVVGALALSFAPVIFLFLFAYGLMNRSIDKWFSRPVEEVRQDTARVGALLSNYARENAHAEAQALAQDPDIRSSFAERDFRLAIAAFRRNEPALQNGFAVALVNGEAEASYHLPEAWRAVREAMALSGNMSRLPQSVTLGKREYILGAAQAVPNGWILAGLPLPEAFTAAMSDIEASQRRYVELAQQRKLVRQTYMGLLLLLTVMVLFAATWFALFLSKFVTRPVEALAAATQEISRGRLDYRVAVSGGDELGRLVESFNHMASELEHSRGQIVAAARELAEANAALEQRRRLMETILESIPSGVLSLDAERRITHVNPALGRIFRQAGQSGNNGDSALQTGSPLQEVVPPEVWEDLDHLLRRSDRMGSATSHIDIQTQRMQLNAAVTAASLEHEGQSLGYVIVFEDLSDLLKAQKQAAWREVARRVAHEIKNPLTPIALSAERIRRHLERGHPPEAASLEVIATCAETIAGAVETVRTLVDEFSTLARFPTSQPYPADINAIVESALDMFSGRLDGIQVRTFLAPALPKVMADPEAIKRAIANLVDNAAEALCDSMVREVHISTALLSSHDAVEVIVADTGHGVTREMKERLFMPYFSTKNRGTGLGLAIVSRIVEEHGGTIRVEENQPVGARFILELPLAQGVSAGSAQVTASNA